MIAVFVRGFQAPKAASGSDRYTAAMRNCAPVVVWWVAVLSAVLMMPGVGLAQMAAVGVDASRSAVGVDGLSRAGEWTPLRVR